MTDKDRKLMVRIADQVDNLARRVGELEIKKMPTDVLLSNGGAIIPKPNINNVEINMSFTDLIVNEEQRAMIQSTIINTFKGVLNANAPFLQELNITYRK